MTSSVSSARARQKERIFFSAGEGAGSLREAFAQEGEETEQRLVSVERTALVLQGEVLGDRQLVEDDAFLRRVPQPQVAAAVPGGRGQVMAAERQPARPYRQVPGHQLHQGRLADPVAAGDESKLSGSDGGREAVDDRDVPMAATQPVDRQQGGAHPLLPPA